MAPRRQKRKSRLSRMDAALDAVTPYGFSGLRVRQSIRQLLKEYGGNEGWPFIEAYAYKELIDAILRDGEASNYHMESVEDQNSSKPDEEGGDVSSGTSVAKTGEKYIQEAQLPSAPSNLACPEMDVEVEVEGEDFSEKSTKKNADEDCKDL